MLKSSLMQESSVALKVGDKESCRYQCNKRRRPVTIFSAQNSLAGNNNCFCFDSFSVLASKISDAKRQTCKSEVFLTDSATQFCSEATFLDPESPKQPIAVVSLVSAPGSGNTWTRFLLQRLTGILSGSAYTDKSLVRMGLVGETEPYDSHKTSFVKNHFLNVTANYC